MPETIRPVPAEFGSLIVQLTVDDVDAAVRFYARAFGADELFRNCRPDDPRVFHDEFLERGLPAPAALGGTPVTIHLYVADAEATFADALAAGAISIAEVAPRFWGVRSGVLRDPFGHRWVIATRVEDLGPDEILERSAEVAANERLPVGKAGLHR
jgi:PhnB protein